MFSTVYQLVFHVCTRYLINSRCKWVPRTSLLFASFGSESVKSDYWTRLLISNVSLSWSWRKCANVNESLNRRLRTPGLAKLTHFSFYSSSSVVHSLVIRVFWKIDTAKNVGWLGTDSISKRMKNVWKTWMSVSSWKIWYTSVLYKLELPQ